MFALKEHGEPPSLLLLRKKLEAAERDSEWSFSVHRQRSGDGPPAELLDLFAETASTCAYVLPCRLAQICWKEGL